MFPFIVNTDWFGFKIVVLTANLVAAVAIPVAGLIYILLLKDKTQWKRHLVFLAAIVGAALLGAKLAQFAVDLVVFRGEGVGFILLASGSTVTGGIMGGGLFVLLYLRLQRRRFIGWREVDALTIAFAAGEGILRIGCLFYGCCFGKVCADSPLALHYPPDWIMHSVFHLDIPFGPRLPFPIIASGSLFLIGFVLFIVYKKVKTDGLTAAFFFLLYGVYRFLVEFIRDEPNRLEIGPFSYGQWFALACLPVGLILLFIALKRNKVDHEGREDHEGKYGGEK